MLRPCNKTFCNVLFKTTSVRVEHRKRKLTGGVSHGVRRAVFQQVTGAGVTLDVGGEVYRIAASSTKALHKTATITSPS